MSALEAISEYGVPPSIVHHIALNNWTITDAYRDCFSKYYLLHWNTGFMLNQVVDGMIEHDGIDYIVIYHRTTRGQIVHELQTGYKKQVMLSFRKPQYVFELPAYVLIN